MLQFNQSQIKIFVVFLIGLSLGWLLCLMAGVNKTEHKVGYISKEEILSFEKARVAKTSEITLFKGRAAQSAELINKIGSNLESKYLSVIFTSEKIEGKNVFSLSRKVHEETMKKLNKLIEEEKVPVAPK